MRKTKIVFAILIACTGAIHAQTQVNYRIERAGRDSFYLIETVLRPMPGTGRNQKTETPMLFTGTADFLGYIDEIKREYDRQAAQIKLELSQQEVLAAKIRAIREQAKKAGLNVN